MKRLLILFLALGSFSTFAQDELGDLPLNVLLQRKNLVISLKESIYLSKGEVISTPIVENLKIDHNFNKSSFSMKMKMANGKESSYDQEIISNKQRVVTGIKLTKENCISHYDGWGGNFVVCDAELELKIERSPYSIFVNHYYLKSYHEFGKNKYNEPDFSKYRFDDVKERLSEFMDISIRKKANTIRN